MNLESEKCKKCLKSILKSNLLLHESTCPGRKEFTMQQRNTNQQEEEFYHCQDCDMYFDIMEKGDHMLSHQYANESNMNGVEDEEQSHSDEDIIMNGNNFHPNRNNQNINMNMNRQNLNNNQVISSQVNDVNGLRTVTQTIRHPNGSVTTTTRTINLNNSNSNNRNRNDFNNISDPFADLFGRGSNFSNIRLGGMNMNPQNSFPPNLIFSSNSRDFETFLQQLLTGRAMDHPVEENILSVLPEIIIEDVNKLPEEKRDCVVCLSNYEVNDKVLILPCTHIFHTKCIKDWFKTQDTCPICKFKIDDNSLNQQ